MKPSWKKAPDWAQWLAMDEDGSWWWYDEKPREGDDGFKRASATSRFDCAGDKPDWVATLEPKPFDPPK